MEFLFARRNYLVKFMCSVASCNISYPLFGSRQHDKKPWRNDPNKELQYHTQQAVAHILPACKRPCLCFRYRTGTSLQLRLMHGIFSNTMSLNCKLVPVQYRESKYGLLQREQNNCMQQECEKKKTVGCASNLAIQG